MLHCSEIQNSTKLGILGLSLDCLLCDISDFLCNLTSIAYLV